MAVFDNGHLRENPVEAQKMMDSLLSGMRREESKISKVPLIEVHDSVWQRIVKVFELLCFNLCCHR